MTIKVDPTEFAGRRVLVRGGAKGLGHEDPSAGPCRRPHGRAFQRRSLTWISVQRRRRCPKVNLGRMDEAGLDHGPFCMRMEFANGSRA